MSMKPGQLIIENSEEWIPFSPYLPGEKAAEIWLALHAKTAREITTVDALTKSERDLYDLLTARFSNDVNMVGFAVKDSR